MTHVHTSKKIILLASENRTMSTHDKKGREYARHSILKVGDVVETDDGFDCMSAGPKTVIQKHNVLCIQCFEGLHMLDGQLNHNSDHLIGIYPVKDKP